MGENNTGERYFCSIRNEKDDKTDPHFQVKIKTGPKEYKRLPDVQWILGYLYKVEKSDYPYKGETKQALKMYFKSGEDTYVLGGTYTSIMRSIINSLAGADAFGAILLRLYVNKTGFPSIWCQNVADPMDWKYNWDEQMRAAGWQQSPSDKKIPDDALARLNKFFEGVLLNDISDIIDDSPPAPPEEPQYVERAAKKKEGEETEQTLEEATGLNDTKSVQESNANADAAKEEEPVQQETTTPAPEPYVSDPDDDLPF